LRGLLSRYGGTLSGGEQQLLALARCLCGKPKIMLLDEPSEGIQPSVLDEIAEVLGEIKSTAGTSMVLVEQNVEFLAALEGFSAGMGELTLLKGRYAFIFRSAPKDFGKLVS